jgi:tRNA pseudouridine32 synthase / 23S rRNA pseudouridine746 synthase
MLPDASTILFQDQRFVVLDKPAGLPVHAGPSGGCSVEDWFGVLSRRKDGPWLAHRLDADTAGCLVIALRRAPLLAAQALFARGSVRKTYWAVVDGEISRDRGTVTAPLRRSNSRRGWHMIVDERSGQPATTDWQVLGRAKRTTWLELRPRTGRTHQIRVHCATLGTPILGDERYGKMNGGLHLLARAIHLPLDPPVDATARPPAHMLAALEECGFRE